MKTLLLFMITLTSTVSYADFPTFKKISCQSKTSSQIVKITLARENAVSFKLSLYRGIELSNAKERELISHLECEVPDSNLAVDRRVVACTVPNQIKTDSRDLYYVAISKDSRLGVGSPTSSTPGQIGEYVQFVVTIFTPDLMATNAQSEYKFQVKECSVQDY
jgi:hypothetical protein